MNQHQHELLNLLVHHEPTAAAKKFLKRTFQQFVLEYGSWYEPAPLPDGITCGPNNECFKNAALLTSTENSFIYCEGFALLKAGHKSIEKGPEGGRTDLAQRLIYAP